MTVWQQSCIILQSSRTVVLNYIKVLTNLTPFLRVWTWLEPNRKFCHLLFRKKDGHGSEKNKLIFFFYRLDNVLLILLYVCKSVALVSTVSPAELILANKLFFRYLAQSVNLLFMQSNQETKNDLLVFVRF